MTSELKHQSEQIYDPNKLKQDHHGTAQTETFIYDTLRS